MVAERIQDKQVSVKKYYARAEIIGNWDDEQLREVFLNLLANAIDASEPQSTVEVSTELSGMSVGSRSVGAVDQITKPMARIQVVDHGSRSEERRVGKEG